MKDEAQKLLLAEAEEGKRPSGRGWPVVQPNGNSSRWFCLWIFIVPIPTLLLYVVSNFGLIVLFALALLAFVLVGPLLCFLQCYLYTWHFRPFFWPTDMYEKVLYLAHVYSMRGRKEPIAGPEDMPVSGLLPPAELPKGYLDYAVFLPVPYASADEFNLRDDPTIIEKYMAKLPVFEHFDGFEEDESPVEFVMHQLSSVYLPVYQEWQDKWSDQALARFCLHGLGAHRVDTEMLDGKRYFVVKTNALSVLPVKHGFERYGGDVYFDQSWKPVMIRDAGLAERPDRLPEIVTTRPGDADWERAKFRFRSSLFALVTMVDHLYDVHLQHANLFVTALRENMGQDHPVRRFMAPFMYRTIGVNDNAFHNLLRKNGLGPRCFALSDEGFALALAAAPTLVTSYHMRMADGAPFHFRSDFAKHLQEQRGVDTEYWRQSSRLYDIYLRFVLAYLDCYYPNKEVLTKDTEMRATARQYFHQLESASASHLGQKSYKMDIDAMGRDERYMFYAKWMAQIMMYVTAIHEQVGAVEVYAQDVSWTAFRWPKGKTCGTKQTATASALLMSFTNMPMPKLMGQDWSHIFPTPATGDPKEAFRKFQAELESFSKYCDDWNQRCGERKFPENFPVYVNNPKLLDLSVSV